MHRSTSYRYRLARSASEVQFVDIVVNLHRETGDWRFAARTTYNLQLSLSPMADLNLGEQEAIARSISLRANLRPQAREVWIEEIRGTGLARGQSFATKTFSQILELTPEINALVLANVMNGTAKQVWNAAMENDGNVVGPRGALVGSLYACGFRQVKAFREGQSAYIGFRASGLRNNDPAV